MEFDFFSDCTTTQELVQRRQDVLSNFNLQYSKKLKELKEVVPKFKKLEAFYSDTTIVEKKDPTLAFRISVIPAKPNEIIMHPDGSISI